MSERKRAPRRPIPPGGPSILAARPVGLKAPPHVYRWDLDKTYLKTEFDTLKQLLRSALERAEEKRAVPGAAALLRELRRGGARICFISGSPRQMRRVLTRKLELDGVEFDEFILKPNLRNMLTGRFRAMREQVGYKLPALLAGRAVVLEQTRETCFGDDAESDAFVYSLYADLIAGRVSSELLEEILKRVGAYHADTQHTVALAETLPRAEAVERIFIHLDRRSPTAQFDRYGPRLVPIFNYFQAALVLYQDRRLEVASVCRVMLEMIERFDYSRPSLENSLHDLLRRSRIERATVEELGRRLAAEAAAHAGAVGEVLGVFAARLGELDASVCLAAPPDAPIDYLAALEADLPKKRRSRWLESR